MKISNVHRREVPLSPRAAFEAIEDLGTDADALWPAPRMPFRRTPGPLRVGLTEERHGMIRAVLDRYEPGRAIVWRAQLPFLRGTHGFEVKPTSEGAAVAHVLEAELAWWFAPVWRARIGAVHDRIIEGLLDRLEGLAGADRRRTTTGNESGPEAEAAEPPKRLK